MKYTTLILLVITRLVLADELPEDECNQWLPAPGAVPGLSVNDFPIERARLAKDRLAALREKGTKNLSTNEKKEFLTAGIILKGYVLRKRLLNVRENGEPDNDEKMKFCEYWSALNFGKNES